MTDKKLIYQITLIQLCIILSEFLLLNHPVMMVKIKSFSIIGHNVLCRMQANKVLIIKIGSALSSILHLYQLLHIDVVCYLPRYDKCKS